MPENRNGKAVDGWVDALDPGLRESAQAYLRDLLSAKPNDFKEWTGERALCKTFQAQVSALPETNAPVPLPMVAILTFFFGLMALRTNPAAGVIVIVAGLLVALWSYAQQENRKVATAAAKQSLLNAAIPEALAHVSRTRTERAYRDAVLELLPTGSDEYVSGDLRREQMGRLGTLLDSGKRLDITRAEIASALTVNAPESLRADAAKLRERLGNATDPGTRYALAQSLALCDERLRRAESLATLTERIEAEQEVVYQAFGAARSSLASLRVSPTVAGWDTEGGAVASRVSEVAESITRQTQAVEAAVQELGIHG